jgi:hypothetical protein
MHEIYSFFPRSEDFQRAEIKRIKSANPGFAIICDVPTLGSDRLRFSNTHPLIYRYILDQFEPLLGYSENPLYQIYKKRRTSS